jgi:pyruvate dehydrogenase complex dehydrogenase (E1) component
MGSGSEVTILLEAGERLAKEGLAVRMVSFPSWELFAAQSAAYRDSVLLPEVSARVAIEAGVPQGWDRWVGPEGVVLGLDHYGASAPYQDLYRHFGLTADAVVRAVRGLLSPKPRGRVRRASATTSPAGKRTPAKRAGRSSAKKPAAKKASTGRKSRRAPRRA